MSAGTCPASGERHTWKHVKNVSVGSMRVTQRGTTGTFTLKGLYRCQCGAIKHGKPDTNGPDLRGMVGDSIRVAGFSTRSSEAA